MRLARWLLHRLAPQIWRESIDGDIAEERQRRLSAGKRASGMWAAFAAVVAIWALRRERADGLASVPPAGRHPLRGVALDVRQGFRSLLSTPGITLTAVVVFALGIGATTAIFTVVDVALLRPLPFDQPDRLVVVGENFLDRPATVPGFVGSAAAVNYFEWQRQQTVFAALGTSQNASGFTVRDRGEPENLQTIRATASLFDVLRVRPQLGQFFTTHHETAGRDRVLVIGDGLWRRRFGADPEIVGKTMTFDSGVWEIIGVLPPAFTFPVQMTRPTDLVVPWVPPSRELIRDLTKTGRNYNLRVVGRLRDGVTVEQARAEMEGITAGLKAAYPAWFKDVGVAVATLHASVVGRTRDWMLLMLGAVGFVLLIACANVANLLLSRASARGRETLVRSALGASRWRLVRAWLVESLLLSALGLAGALLLASWGVGVLKAAMPTSIPRLGELGLDLRILIVSSAAATLTGLLCGLAPAWHLSRSGVQGGLREGGRGGTAGPGRQRLRAVLLVTEVALALMLVVGAGLFVTSFVRLIGVDLGIDYTKVASVNVSPRIDTSEPLWFEKGVARTPGLITQVVDRLRATPGVETAAVISGGSPMSGSWKTNSITVQGKPEFKSDQDQVQIREVTPEYDEVVRLPLRRGRFIESTDHASAPKVVVLNDEAVRRFFDGQEPIGATVRLDDADRVVIGIVGNVRVRGPEIPLAPEAYFPLAQVQPLGATVLVRAAGDPAALLPEMRRIVLSVIPDVPPTVTTMAESLKGLTSQRRFTMLLVGSFGVLAIVIAAVGIYGSMAFAVAQQTREIGVRMALGAVPSGVLLMVLRRASVYLSIGVAIGLGGAWLLAGSVRSFLFSVEPTEPMVYAAVSGLLLATGLLAAIVPARRAATVDPVVALRTE